MNTYIEVFDVLADHLYRDAADINVIIMSLSIHFDSPLVQTARWHRGYSHQILPELRAR